MDSNMVRIGLVQALCLSVFYKSKSETVSLRHTDIHLGNTFSFIHLFILLPFKWAMIVSMIVDDDLMSMKPITENVRAVPETCGSL